MKALKEALIRHLQGFDSLLVAFSGGVDSTFLLAMASQVLGDRAVAVTCTSIIYPQRELEEAAVFTREHRIEHLHFVFPITSLPEFIANGPERCYHCKRLLFRSLKEIAEKRGIRHIAHAANLDDLEDYRPGGKAAQEMGILAPLVDCGFRKADIRRLSREMGLACWDRPAMACFASRIPYGDAITETKLRMVEQAEQFLYSQGFSHFRVRHHGPVARIEVAGSDLKRMLEPGIRQKTVEALRNAGFHHIALDLEGYVTGSLNRALDRKDRSDGRQE